MIKTYTYNENGARLTIYTDKKAYHYRDVPYSIYLRIKILIKNKSEGRAWNLIKKYPIDEVTYGSDGNY